MSFLENLKKHLITVIDFPLELAQEKHLPSRTDYTRVKGTSQKTFSSLKNKQIVVPQKMNSSQEQPQAEQVSTPQRPSTYTHGLEKIYALETVDLKSVRVMQQKEDSQKKLHIPESPESKDKKSGEQLEFDFGPLWREWITPCKLYEPISVLELSPQAEKTLISRGWKTLQDLMKIDRETLLYLKGLGQGHIDDLLTKLNLYIGSESLEKSKSIDWAAWLRHIVSELSSKEAKVLLEKYQLSEVLKLPSYVASEIRHLEKQSKDQLVEQALSHLREEKALSVVNERWRNILHAFILPWIAQRKGFASFREIQERFKAVSVQPDLTEKMFYFLADLNQTSQDQLFRWALHPIRYFLDFCTLTEDKLPLTIPESIYTINQTEVTFYAKVYQLVHSYFYRSHLIYPLDTLMHWLRRDLTQQWETFCEQKIIAVLYRIPTFHIYKNTQQQTQIRLRKQWVA